ncbi:MAG: MarP family serine protease [Nocardioidaceae bacterium]|nr:MarP family serine protease [Nocardioidaceae bacterium]
MNVLDLVLLLAVVVYAASGYRQGFVVGSASTFGLLAGGFLGAQITPPLLDGFDAGFEVSVAALMIVLACAFGGQALGAFSGLQLRSRITWRPARVFDAIGGSVLSGVAVLLIAWVLGVAVSGARLQGLNQEVRSSAVLQTVDEVLPGGADNVLSAFNSIVDASHFPDYLDPFATERIKDVVPPTSRIAQRPSVARAEASVVKIVGAATSCGRNIEGSGFVFAPQLVMTNAHVVAGVRAPTVSVGGGAYESEIVYYDSDVDVAVLAVPGLDASALHFDASAETGEAAAVLGFPENGPYDVRPARVRDRQSLRSADIYGDGTVVRDTYSLYSRVRQGNSGGPLVDRQGEVIGVIFAASVTDADTGYALAADQVADAVRVGAASRQPVSTGDCAI